jgi:hypothetical protein
MPSHFHAFLFLGAAHFFVLRPPPTEHVSARRRAPILRAHGRSSWSTGSRDRSDAKAPPVEQADVIAATVETLWEYLAFVPRRLSVRLSVQLERDFRSGCKYARRVVACGLLRGPAAAKREPRKAAAPLPAPITLTPRQLEVQRRSAEAHREMQRDIQSGILDPKSRESTEPISRRGLRLNGYWDRVTRS